MFDGLSSWLSKATFQSSWSVFLRPMHRNKPYPPSWHRPLLAKFSACFLLGISCLLCVCDVHWACFRRLFSHQRTTFSSWVVAPPPQALLASLIPFGLAMLHYYWPHTVCGQEMLVLLVVPLGWFRWHTFSGPSHFSTIFSNLRVVDVVVWLSMGFFPNQMAYYVADATPMMLATTLHHVWFIPLCLSVLYKVSWYSRYSSLFPERTPWTWRSHYCVHYERSFDHSLTRCHSSRDGRNLS